MSDLFEKLLEDATNSSHSTYVCCPECSNIEDDQYYCLTCQDLPSDNYGRIAISDILIWALKRIEELEKKLKEK